MLKNKKILVMLPALNEEKGLPKVLKKMPQFVDHVLVIDNNSTDNTAEVAKELGCNVLFEKRRGKGNAFQAFLKQFVPSEFDFVVMLDSDNTYDASEMEKLIQPLFNGFDVVIGDRLHGQREGKSLNRVNLIGNHLLTFAAKLLYFFEVKDICSGYWAFKSNKLKGLNIREKGFGLEQDLFSQSRKNRLKIESVPICYGLREGKEKLRTFHGFVMLWRLLFNRFF